MPGILDPQTQGILAAAFAGMQASGPSRMPTSLGQVFGAAGSAGMGAYDGAAKLQSALELQDTENKIKKAALEKAALDAALTKQLTEGGGILKAANDPDTLEALGTKLSLGGHPAGASLIAQAEKMRAKKAALGTLKTMQGAELPQTAPENVAGLASSEEDAIRQIDDAAAQGKKATVAVDPNQSAGIFGSLVNSPIPQIAGQARAQQGILNKQADVSTSPQHWIDMQKNLATQEASLVARQENAPPSMHVVQDPSSSTGWSWKDLRSGKVVSTGAPPPSAAAAMPSGSAVPKEHADLHGADYLATLPSGMQNVVESIAKGKTSLSDASMRYGNRDAMKERVLQYDPTFQGNRFKNRQEFEAPNGKTQQNIAAIQTTVAHMGTLERLYSALSNGNVQAVNRVVNEVQKQTGDPRVTNADTAAHAVSNELMRVFRGVGANQSEVEAWDEKFKPIKASPAQLQGALLTGAELLAGRLESVNDTWKRTVDPNSEYPILSPKSAEAFSRIRKLGAPAQSAGSSEEPVRRRKYNPSTGAFE